MKKLIMISVFVLAGIILYGQVTPVCDVRVANATTAFGINISVGMKVYDLNTKKLYACDVASISTLTLTTGAANFTLIGGTGLNGTVTNVTANMYLNVATGTTTPHITPAVGIAKDSLVKMDSLATAGQWAKFGSAGLVGRSSASVYSEIGVKTYKVQQFEVAGDSAGHCILTLTNTPVTGTITVNMNSMPLTATTQWTVVETLKIRMPFTCYQYDKFTISFAY